MDTRYYIDISASLATGDGPVSGVVRVEREIARRLPRLMDCTFVVFDLDRKAYFECEPNENLIRTTRRGPDPVEFPEQSRVFSFGLESNTKCIDTLCRDVERNRYQLDSVLYDMTAPLQPQLSVEGYGEYLRGVYAELFWVVDRYFAISEHAKKQLQQFGAQEFLVPPPCFVFPLGCDALVGTNNSKLPAELAEKQFGLMVSTIEARKNHYVVYRAWDRALEEGLVDPDRDRMVFVGRKGWGVDDLLSMIAANPRTRDTVLILSDIADSELSILYQKAHFCMLPSFDEGYGLPVAEALRAGKLCLCSDRGALPEVAGRHARFLSPIDILGWRDAISELFTLGAAEVDRRAATITEGYEPVTWNDSASELARLIKGANP